MSMTAAAIVASHKLTDGEISYINNRIQKENTREYLRRYRRDLIKNSIYINCEINKPLHMLESINVYFPTYDGQLPESMQDNSLYVIYYKQKPLVVKGIGSFFKQLNNFGYRIIKTIDNKYVACDVKTIKGRFFDSLLTHYKQQEITFIPKTFDSLVECIKTHKLNSQLYQLHPHSRIIKHKHLRNEVLAFLARFCQY